MAQFYRCREPFSYTDRDGVPRMVPVGATWPLDHPDLPGREALFEAVQFSAARTAGVEAATAAPGELRTLTSPEPVKRRPGRPRKVEAS